MIANNSASSTERAVLNVYEIKDILGVGKNQAYELVKSGEFPVKRIGSKYLVSKEIFFSWLNSSCNF